MIISILNHTNGQITDEQLQVAIRAINRQIAGDFEPYWSIGGELRLEGKSGKPLEIKKMAKGARRAIRYQRFARGKSALVPAGGRGRK